MAYLVGNQLGCLHSIVWLEALAEASHGLNSITDTSPKLVMPCCLIIGSYPKDSMDPDLPALTQSVLLVDGRCGGDFPKYLVLG